MGRRRNCVITAACLLAGAATAFPARGAPGDVTNLGTLGGTTSYANGVNDDGVVVGISNLGGIVDHAFRYTPATGMQDLGVLAGDPSSSAASAISPGGTIVGASDNVGSGARAFRHTAGSGMQDLGTVFGGQTSALAVNDAGLVVGEEYTPTGRIRPVYYTPAAGMQLLGDPAGPDGSARGVNASGVIVGYADLLRGGNRAFRYTAATGMQDLGALVTGERSYALDVHDSGVIGGYSHVAPGAQHAFRYTDATGMVDLGILPGGLNSRALAINNAGVVVGTAYRSILATDTIAALWKPDGILVDLDLWLDQINPAEGAKWTLRSANAINESGLVVGSGVYYDGDGGLTDGYVAFMLDATSIVPEPTGTVFAILLGGWAMTRRRRPRN